MSREKRAWMRSGLVVAAILAGLLIWWRWAPDRGGGSPGQGPEERAAPGDAAPVPVVRRPPVTTDSDTAQMGEGGDRARRNAPYSQGRSTGPYEYDHRALEDADVRQIRLDNSALTEDRTISDVVAAHLNMSPEERTEVDRVVAEEFAAAESSLLERLEMVGDSAGGQAGERASSPTTLRFRADPEMAEERLRGFRSRLAEVLGEDRAGDVVNMIPLTNFFGGLGRYDGILTLQPPDSAESPAPEGSSAMKIELFEPDSGRQVLFTVKDYRRVRANLMRVLAGQD